VKATPGERVVKDIRRATRRHFSAEDKIRMVLDGLRGEDSIAELCRKESIAQSLYYVWSKEFMEAGKRRPPPHPNLSGRGHLYSAGGGTFLFGLDNSCRWENIYRVNFLFQAGPLGLR